MAALGTFSCDRGMLHPFEPRQGVEQDVAKNLSRLRRWIKALRETIWAPRRVEVTVQTDRLLIIRRRRLRRAWCQQCGREVNAVSLQEVGSFARASHRILPGNTEPSAWHTCGGTDGEQLVCLESLFKGDKGAV